MAVPVKVIVFLLLSYVGVVLSETRCSIAVSHATASFGAIKPYISEFSAGKLGGSNYSALSIDERHNNLLVGGRDAAFLVDLKNFSKFWSWSSPKSRRSDCVGLQSEENANCHSFVEIMLPFEGRILLCWSGEESSCTWTNRSNLILSHGRDSSGNVFRSSLDYLTGSPSSDHRSTALLTEDGRLFMVSRRSRQTTIYSQSLKPNFAQVSSLVDKTSLYDGVHFAGSFNIGPYVYFFFHERILECSGCGKMQVSRVARICKGDSGGSLYFNKKFVTFQKATLSCSDGEKSSLNFNEIQDVSWDSESSSFYAVFTTNLHGPVSSAVCIFKLTDIEQSFNKNKFLKYNAAQNTWTKDKNRHIEYFKDCKVNKNILKSQSEGRVSERMMPTTELNFATLMKLKDSLLMDGAIQPASAKVWLMTPGIGMTGVVLDKVNRSTVVYASTDKGSVFKIFQPKGIDEPCIMAEMSIFPTGKKEAIKDLAIDSKKHVLYLGSDSALKKLRLEQCGSYGEQRKSCLSARDPYCGWDKQAQLCVSVFSHREPSKLEQDLTSCPDISEVEVGWSQWTTCRENNDNICRCRVRPCQNASCEGGFEYQLENCTVDMRVGWEGLEAWRVFGVVHGNWSAWEEWSGCSVKTRVRKRTRNCNNPAPRRGGRPCMGNLIEYESCPVRSEAESRNLLTRPLRVLNRTQNTAVQLEVTCRAEGYELTNVTIRVSGNKTVNCNTETELCQEGKWKTWSPWSNCSSLNVRLRRRSCALAPCVGDHLQEQPCTPTVNTANCAGGVDRKWGPWSSCFCDHDLNLVEDSGVRYRVPKCRNLCPGEQACPDRIQFDTCNCNPDSSVSAFNEEQNRPTTAAYEIGHVIGAAIVGCVVAAVLCIAAIFYIGRKKKQLNISRPEETSPDVDTSGSGAKYSTVTRENGTTHITPPSPSNQSTESKDRNRNPRVKSHSPLKNLLKKQEYNVSVDAV